MTPIEQNECSICLNLLTTDTITLPCEHIFHINCIEAWKKYNTTCPYCRNDLCVNNYRIPPYYIDELILSDGNIEKLNETNYHYFYYINEGVYTNEQVRINIEKIKLAKQLKSSLRILENYNITGLGNTFFGQLIKITQINNNGYFSCGIKTDQGIMYFSNSYYHFELA